MITAWYLILVIGGGNGAVATASVPVWTQEDCEAKGQAMLGKKIQKSYKDIEGYYCVAGLAK